MLTYIVLLLSQALADSDVVLLPIREGGAPAGLIFVQGAQAPAAQYAPFVKAIQAASSLKLYAVIPAFPLDTPEPMVIGAGMTRSLAALKLAGLPSSAPLLVAAHSLGGVMLQDWTYSNHEQVSAQLLTGSTLLRKYRNGTAADTYPVPTLMMSGTLDGLFRVTRQAESYYHYVTNHVQPPAQFPVVTFEGLSHWSFGSGKAPGLVQSHDLKPEITEEKGHQLAAAVVASFFADVLKAKGFPYLNTTAAVAVSSAVKTSAEIVAPIIASQQQEAFIHLGKACNSDFAMPASCPTYPRYPSGQKKGSNSPHCVCGTPWSAHAQQIMAGPNITVVAADAIHPVSDVSPIHLPHIWSKCTGGAGCALNVTTVTYPAYATLDSEDTGFFSASASELKVKLKSRQSLMMANGAENVNFTATDVVPSTCAEINEQSWAWAMKTASSTAASRFAKLGQPMKFGKDIFLGNAGPVWIENPIEYKISSDKSVMNVYSPCSHTPVDYPIKSAAGFHYCKLVSPARALEHIYIDGLRAKGGLPPQDGKTQNA